jgi:carboxyl-terminal processing protease
MRRFRLALCGWLALLTALVAWPTPGIAQFRTVREIPGGAHEFDEILRVGDQLEGQRRWGEALSHYEEAVRRHPQHGELQQRLTLARLHYDVSRRYADATFVQTIRQLDEQASLDLYGEVLLKIHAHYVESPNWPLLVSQGTTALRVALNEASFAQQYHLPATPAERMAVVDELQHTLAALPMRDRHDARSAALMAGRLAHHRLAIPVSAILLEYCCSAVGALDDYSSFLTQGQLDEVLSQIEGSFVGLGIELKAEAGALRIISAPMTFRPTSPPICSKELKDRAWSWSLSAAITCRATPG